MKNLLLIFLIALLFPKQSLSQDIHKLNQLSKKGASIYVISEISDSIADFPFTKEFSKYFNQNGYWSTTNSINKADLILCLRGYPIAWSNPNLYCYAMVFDKEFNFLYRTNWYCAYAGWKIITEQYNKPFCKKIIEDIKKAKILKTKGNRKNININDFENYYLKGVDYMENYRYKEAIKLFNKCIEIDSEQWQLYKIIGYCNMELEEYKCAVENFDQYLEHNPMDYALDPLYAMAIGLKIQKRMTKNLRLAQILSIGGIAINEALGMYATVTNTSLPNLQPTTVQPSSYKSEQQYSSNLLKKECSFCHGTGYNLSKERPPFYSYNDDPKTGSCSTCGDKSIHYHKSCASCMGKGYVLTHIRK